MARQSEPISLAARGVPVLVTRPADQGKVFADTLIARFGARVHPILSPIMAAKFLSPPMPAGPFAAVAFTSAQGVEGARRLQADLPRRAYCVGQATAAAAARAGFDARSADGDVAALAATVLDDPPPGQILYLRGVDTAGDLETTLKSNGFSVLSLQVYLQKPVPLSGESHLVLRRPGPVVLPLFSPRSARLFRDELPADAQADLRIAAMSEAVAQAATGLPHSALSIAARPDTAGMLEAVESLLAPTPAP